MTFDNYFSEEDNDDNTSQNDDDYDDDECKIFLFYFIFDILFTFMKDFTFNFNNGTRSKISTQLNKWTCSVLQTLNISVITNNFLNVEEYTETPFLPGIANPNAKEISKIDANILMRLSKIYLRCDDERNEADVKLLVSLILMSENFFDGDKFSFDMELASNQKTSIKITDYTNSSETFTPTSDFSIFFDKKYCIAKIECKDKNACDVNSVTAQLVASLLSAAKLNLEHDETTTVFGVTVVGFVFRFFQTTISRKYLDYVESCKTKDNDVDTLQIFQYPKNGWSLLVEQERNKIGFALNFVKNFFQ